MSRPSPTPSPRLTRRAMLTAGSALALTSAIQWPAQAATGMDADAFLALSKELTGKVDLDGDIAAKMLNAFETIGKADEIAALANGQVKPDLGNDIVAAWYSGFSPDPDSSEVVAYNDALMWQAMPYTKPMGQCGGETGYWAEPPAG